MHTDPIFLGTRPKNKYKPGYSTTISYFAAETGRLPVYVDSLAQFMQFSSNAMHAKQCIKNSKNYFFLHDSVTTNKPSLLAK